MRTISFLMLLIGFSFFAQGQCINGKLAKPIHDVGAEIISQIDNEGFEVVRAEYDLIFTSKDTYRTLTTSWEYALFAFADNGVADLDIAVYEYDDLLEHWTLILKDDGPENTATVTFTPAKDQQYKITITVKEYVEGYDVARYGLIIFHD